MNILNQPIEELKFSDEFQEFANANKLQTLSDFIMIGTKQLDQSEGFSKRMLVEYLSFLEENDLEKFMDEEV
jgi:hypothetical protein